jgi:hypothetical protein
MYSLECLVNFKGHHLSFGREKSGNSKNGIDSGGLENMQREQGSQ